MSLLDSDGGEDRGEDVLEGLRDGGAVDLEEELVEERGGGAHYEAGLVEASDALAVGGDDSAREVGA
jgi:hypothetical protein